MTKYTAADFANAKFAEHEDGRTAMKPSGHTRWDVKLLDGRRSVRGNCHMASFGWVPVPTKPTITESRLRELTEIDRTRGLSVRGVLQAYGVEVIPDPEPTNTERLVKLIDEWREEIDPGVTLAEWLDEHGVTALNAKGNND